MIWKWYKLGLFRLPTVLEPWYAFKKQLAENYGLLIGGSYGVLWQNYSSSLFDEHNSVGGKFTFNLSYQLINRGTPDAMWFEAVVEDRRPLGTDLAPLAAGLTTGSLAATAPTWGAFNLGLTQFYFRQNLFDNHFQYAIGKLFAPNFVDAYPLFDDNRQYLNQLFTTSVTIPVPLRGAGAVAAWFPTETGLYVMSGMYTVHSSDTGPTIYEFFAQPQYFYHVELGWSGLGQSDIGIQGRGPTDFNNVHVTAWHRDAETFGPASSQGLAFNANYSVSENAMVFLRGGWSQGWLIDKNVSTGFGWRPFPEYSDLFGFGVGWANPTDHALREQYTLEVFYRFQLTPNLAMTPDLQLILNPALNPNKDTVWVFGFRTRLTF